MATGNKNSLTPILRLNLQASFAIWLSTCRLEFDSSATEPSIPENDLQISLDELGTSLSLLIEIFYDESGPPVGALATAGCAEREFKEAAQKAGVICLQTNCFSICHK